MTDQLLSDPNKPDEELSDDFITYLFVDAWDMLVNVIEFEDIAGADPQPRLIRVRHAPSPGLTTFATLTQGRFVDADGRTARSMDGEDVPIHVEYSLIVRTDQEAEALPALKTVVQMLYDGKPVPEGVTGGPFFGHPALGRTVSASHLLVIPNRWGFGQQPMRTRVLEMLQLLPITPLEEEYTAEHGYSGMLGALNGNVFDPADLSRRSVVRRGSHDTWEVVFPDSPDA